MISGVIDTIWPTLPNWRSSELAETRKSNLHDIEKIRTTCWEHESELALEFAKKTSDEEGQRRHVADSKATTYLMMIAAFVALFTYLENAIWDSKFGTAPKWAVLPLLILGVCYISNAGLWCVRALEVRNFSRIDVGELLQFWRNRDSKQKKQLIIEILICALQNRSPTNDKISCVIMAQKFIFRSIMCFGALVVVAAFWGIGRELAIV